MEKLIMDSKIEKKDRIYNGYSHDKAYLQKELQKLIHTASAVPKRKKNESKYKS